MADGKDPRERSFSAGDLEDSDLESHAEGGHQSQASSSKPGRKKNPNSQAARRDQNRIAQREFRLRKQQKIRDLEARVELLSGGKDEALGDMRNIMKDLMDENQTLRNLLRGVSQFIGEGAGGLLPRLGWSMVDFNNFIARSETDTAWESFQKRKKGQSANDGVTSSSQPQKRSSEDNEAGRAKKARVDKDGERNQDGYLFSPLNPTVPANNVYSGSTRPPPDAGLFSELMRTSGGSPMFMQSSPTSTSATQFAGQSSASYPSPYMNMGVETNLPSLPFSAGGKTQTTQPRINQPAQVNPETVELDDNPNKVEAYKLIHYHLDNYKRNSAYCLPSSLRPTLVQRTVPHESVIDKILHPELRDHMILRRGRLDLVDCLLDYRSSVTIHGDDVLAHANWEIGEKWLRQYGFLVDQSTLNITNRWRRERGEPELRLADIAGAEHTPGST